MSFKNKWKWIRIEINKKNEWMQEIRLVEKLFFINRMTGGWHCCNWKYFLLIFIFVKTPKIENLKKFFRTIFHLKRPKIIHKSSFNNMYKSKSQEKDEKNIYFYLFSLCPPTSTVYFENIMCRVLPVLPTPTWPRSYKNQKKYKEGKIVVVVVTISIYIDDTIWPTNKIFWEPAVERKSEEKSWCSNKNNF